MDTSSPSGEYVEFEVFMRIHMIFEAEHRGKKRKRHVDTSSPSEEYVEFEFFMHAQRIFDASVAGHNNETCV